MAKKNNPYGRLKERFIAERAEDRGYSELTLAQKEQFSRRFDVLAQSVEGRGKIVQQILGPDAPQERRKAMRQRIRQNLPQRGGQGTTPEEPTSPTAPTFTSPAGRVGSPSLRGAMTSPSAANLKVTSTKTKKQGDGRIGSGFWSIPDSIGGAFKEAGQELKAFGEQQARLYVNPALNVGMSALEKISGGSYKYKKFAEPTKSEVLTEAALIGLTAGAGVVAKPIASAAGKLAGSFGMGLVERGAVKTGTALVGYSQRQQALAAVRAQLAREQLGTKLMSGGAEALEGVKPGTKPAGSKVNRPLAPGQKKVEVVAEPKTTVKPKTGSKGAAKTGPKGAAAKAPKGPKAATPKAAPANVTFEAPAVSTPPPPPPPPPGTPPPPLPKTEVIEPKIVFETPSAPKVTAPEVSAIEKEFGPVKFAEPAPAGTMPTTELQKSASPVAEVQPSTAVKGKKGGKKSKAAKPEAKVTFEDKTNVEPAKGTPAAGEVVGGAAPKAQVEPTLPSITQPSPQKSLPASTASKKKSANLVEPSAQPSPSAAASKKPSTQVWKQPKVASYTEYVDPVTGKKVKHTVYESQAKEMAARQERLKAQGIPSGTMTFEDKPLKSLSSGSTKPKIVFEEQTTKQGEKLMVPANEAAQKMQDEFLIVRADPTKPQQTFANIEWQFGQQAEAEEIAARLGTNPPRRSIDEMAEEILGGKKPDLWGQERKQAVEKAVAEERRRLPSQRRNIKTRRKGLGEIPGRKTKRAPKTLEEATAEAKKFDKEVEGRIKKYTGTKEEAAAAEPRTVEEIRRDVEILRQRFEKQQRDLAKSRKKSKSRNINQRSPEVVLKEQAAARERSVKIEELGRMAEQGKDVLTTSGRSGRSRATYRKELRASVRKGRIEQDITPGLRQTANFEDADFIERTELPAVDFTQEKGIADLSAERIRRSYVENPETPFVELPPEPAKGVTFFQFDPKKFDYEKLLAVEEAGFKPQLRRGVKGPELVYSKEGRTFFDPDAEYYFPGTRQWEKGRWVTEPAKSMSPEEFAALMRTDKVGPKELKRLIKATTTKAKK